MLMPSAPVCYRSPHRMPTSSTADASLATAPTATAAVEAGADGQSTKRKYSQAMTVRERMPALNVNVTKVESEDRLTTPCGSCNSPRSLVADRLDALDIDQDAPRKRVKTTTTPVERDETRFGPEMTPMHSRQFPPNLDHAARDATLEIAETPNCRPSIPHHSPAQSPLPARQPSSNPPTNPTSPPKPKTSPKRMRSPPPPPPSSSTTKPTHPSPPTNTTSPPSSSSESSSWQPTEITGHEIHPSLGDDGEGINGIGFRPTPAIAQARSQKRKQQVNAWRAREAREARQRRFEKRQGGGCGGDVDVGGEGGRGTGRVVRFEGVG